MIVRQMTTKVSNATFVYQLRRQMVKILFTKNNILGTKEPIR